MIAYLKLMRFPNVFSAFADVLMGWLVAKATFLEPWTHEIATSQEWTQLGLLLLASAGLYLAGMVLNDVFDYEVDAVERPSRPLPSGRIPRARAATLGWSLLGIGVLAAAGSAFVSDQWITLATAIVLAAAVVAYDGGMKRTPLGPLVMGSCRFLNVLLGMTAGADPWPNWQLMLAGGIGLYIVGVTIFAKGEAEAAPNQTRLIVGLATLLAGMALLWGTPVYFKNALDVVFVQQTTVSDWHILWLALAGLIGFRCLWAISDPSPQLVQAAVMQCLRSLIILDAVACFSVCGLYGALWILPLVIPQMLLARVIYTT